MNKELTTSAIDRQNVLNNDYALIEIEKATGIQGIVFEGKTVLLKEQVAQFFEVTPRTIDNYLALHSAELSQNGYVVLKGKSLKLLKNTISERDVHETDFVNITKASQLGIFGFRAFLNLAMLLSESQRAKLLRKTILDIVIDTINQRTGGGTKYINQRDEDFLHATFSGESYRKKFTDALRDYVAMGNFKYAVYTDKIYASIFKEHAKEYRKILKLSEQENVRDTMYAEILDLIASYENGLCDVLKNEFTKRGRQLYASEVDSIFTQFEAQALLKPLIDKARMKMASRDLAFRDALHDQLSNYITPLQRDDYERFLGDKSKALEARLQEAKDVMRRLKDRE